jgi:hypothetical protein
VLHVVDARSNVNENVVSAAEFLGKSDWRTKVFKEIYRGKPKPKTAADISARLRCPEKRVLMAGNELRKAGLVEQLKVGARVAYQKEGFLDQHKARILRLAKNKAARERVPTKARPASSTTIRLQISTRLAKAKQVTVDDIRSFSKVKKVRTVPAKRMALPERVFKEGIQAIIQEPGKFVDSPGERFDLLSTRVFLKTARIATAFAFKGPGKKGILRPASMGRNGDQIQRLFHSEAELFLLQYWGQVDESVVEQMRVFATARSVYTGERVLYGVIDGRDSDRLVLAYPDAFQPQRTRKK